MNKFLINNNNNQGFNEIVLIRNNDKSIKGLFKTFAEI